LGRDVHRIAPEAQKLLLAYSWPGNIRELKNVIERAMILSNSDELLPVHLPYEIAGHINDNWRSPLDPWEHWLSLHPSGPLSLDELSARIEKHFICWALETTRHNRSRAAELLGFTKVDQLRYLMRKYGIE
jgi:two-component system, NtrC family, response regulator AtoC